MSDRGTYLTPAGEPEPTLAEVARSGRPTLGQVRAEAVETLDLIEAHLRAIAAIARRDSHERAMPTTETEGWEARCGLVHVAADIERTASHLHRVAARLHETS